MDWNRIRGQWQAATVASAPTLVLSEVQRRDRELRGQVRRRDWLETVVAALLVPFFAVVAWKAYARAEWMALLFSGVIVASCVYTPLHLWRARRALPRPHPELALLDYLRQERLAMLGQARMLEQVWYWYLGPCAIGVLGLVLSVGGVNPRTLIFTGTMLVVYAAIGWVNKYAARVGFRAHAADIERQIAILTEESA